jgi:glutamate-ammonia-ligase adenylyltransferase
MNDEQIIIPENLSTKKWLIDKYVTELNHPLKNSLHQLILVSDYACKHLPLIIELMNQEPYLSPLSREEYFSKVHQLTIEQSQQNFAAELRQYRHTHLLRLLLLEYGGLINTEEAMRSWSDCADAMILHSLKFCQKVVTGRYGTHHATGLCVQSGFAFTA